MVAIGEHVDLLDGHVVSGFFVGWTSAYALLVGCFALASFALLVSRRARL